MAKWFVSLGSGLRLVFGWDGMGWHGMVRYGPYGGGMVWAFCFVLFCFCGEAFWAGVGGCLGVCLWVCGYGLGEVGRDGRGIGWCVCCVDEGFSLAFCRFRFLLPFSSSLLRSYWSILPTPLPSQPSQTSILSDRVHVSYLTYIAHFTHDGVPVSFLSAYMYTFFPCRTVTGTAQHSTAPPRPARHKSRIRVVRCAGAGFPGVRTSAKD